MPWEMGTLHDAFEGASWMKWAAPVHQRGDDHHEILRYIVPILIVVARKQGESMKKIIDNEKPKT